MILSCDSSRFAPSPRLWGSESDLFLPEAHPTERAFTRARDLTDPILRRRHSPACAFGREYTEHEKRRVEVLRYHVHTLGRIIVDQDPRNLQNSIPFNVLRVHQGSEPEKEGKFPSSFTTFVSDAQLLADNKTIVAHSIYDLYRIYGIAHDCSSSRNTFVTKEGQYISIELLDILSPEALRAISLLPASSPLRTTAIRSCACVLAHNLFSPYPLPPHQYLRRDIPDIPGSYFTRSILDLTYYWKAQLAPRHTLQHHTPLCFPLEEQVASTQKLWRELGTEKERGVAQSYFYNAFGVPQIPSRPLDLRNGSNLHEYGIDPAVFTELLGLRARYENAVTQKALSGT